HLAHTVRAQIATSDDKMGGDLHRDGKVVTARVDLPRTLRYFSCDSRHPYSCQPVSIQKGRVYEETVCNRLRQPCCADRPVNGRHGADNDPDEADADPKG